MAYITPYNDEKLIYDKDLHAYLLNPQYIVNTFLEFNDSDLEWKQKQYDLTESVYSFIKSFKTGRENQDHLEYDLACNEDYRDVIVKALLLQYQYASTTEGDTLQLQTGISLGDDKNTPTSSIRGELMISTKGYKLLYQSGLLESTYRTDFDYSLYRVNY